MVVVKDGTKNIDYILLQEILDFLIHQILKKEISKKN